MAYSSRKGQAKCSGAMTTSHDGKAGVMTRVLNQGMQESWQMQPHLCTLAIGSALWPAKLLSQAVSSKQVVLKHAG